MYRVVRQLCFDPLERNQCIDLIDQQFKQSIEQHHKSNAKA